MKIIIVGGGKTGYYLSSTMQEPENKIVLIDEDYQTCSRIAADLGINVICGDGTDPRVLEEAGIHYAEIVAAVTGSDEKNLIICKIAKVNYPVKETIAKVNNPKNEGVFNALGITDTVCISGIISKMAQSRQAG